MDEAEDFQDRIKISNSNTTALIEDLESVTRQLKHATKGLNKMTSEFTSLIMDIKRQLHHNQERIITQTVIANITSLQNEPTLWNPWNEWILLDQTSTKLSIGASSTSININHIHTIRPHHMEHHISTITSHKWLPPTTSLHILWTSHLKMTPSIFNCFPSFNKS